MDLVNEMFHSGEMGKRTRFIQVKWWPCYHCYVAILLSWIRNGYCLFLSNVIRLLLCSFSSKWSSICPIVSYRDKFQPGAENKSKPVIILFNIGGKFNSFSVRLIHITIFNSLFTFCFHSFCGCILQAGNGKRKFA